MPNRTLKDLRRSIEPIAPPVGNTSKAIPPPLADSGTLPEKIEQRRRNLKSGKPT